MSRRLALLYLPKEIKEELVRPHTTTTVAQEILSVDKENVEEMMQTIVEHKLSSRDVRILAKSYKENKDLNDLHEA